MFIFLSLSSWRARWGEKEQIGRNFLPFHHKEENNTVLQMTTGTRTPELHQDEIGKLRDVGYVCVEQYVVV